MPDSVIVAQRDHLAVASIKARKGATHSAIGAALGADLPNGPRAAFVGNRTLVGTGPGAWLVIEERAALDFADVLQQTLNGLASVSDQSGAYSVHRLSGLGSRTLLQRGAAIDFHPANFSTGSAATTVIEHIGVVLWQVDEQPTYDVATFRSYAGSFCHWLDKTAAVL